MQKKLLNQNIEDIKMCSECGKLPAIIENELCGLCWESRHITESHTKKHCFIVGNQKHPQNKSAYHWPDSWDYLDEQRAKKDNEEEKYDNK